MALRRRLTPVTRLPLPPRILDVLVRRGRFETVQEVLELSAQELQTRTNLSTSDVSTVIAAASHEVAPGPAATALDVRSGGHLERLGLGDFVLDSFLRGGLLVPGLTEIAGESAAGKTQLCLQLCLAVQLPSEYGGLGSGTWSVTVMWAPQKLSFGSRGFVRPSW